MKNKILTRWRGLSTELKVLTVLMSVIFILIFTISNHRPPPQKAEIINEESIVKPVIIDTYNTGYQSGLLDGMRLCYGEFGSGNYNVAGAEDLTIQKKEVEK